MNCKPAQQEVMDFLERTGEFVHVGGIARRALVSTATVRTVLSGLNQAGKLETGHPAPDPADQRRAGTVGYRLKRSAPAPELPLFTDIGVAQAVRGGSPAVQKFRDGTYGVGHAVFTEDQLRYLVRLCLKALGTDDGVQAITGARAALASGEVPVPDCDLITVSMEEVLVSAGADRRIERLVALLIDQRAGDGTP